MPFWGLPPLPRWQTTSQFSRNWPLSRIGRPFRQEAKCPGSRTTPRLRTGGQCRHQPARRRHCHHEYHAGFGYRANARNGHSARNRRVRRRSFVGGLLSHPRRICRSQPSRLSFRPWSAWFPASSQRRTVPSLILSKHCVMSNDGPSAWHLAKLHFQSPELSNLFGSWIRSTQTHRSIPARNKGVI